MSVHFGKDAVHPGEKLLGACGVMAACTEVIEVHHHSSEPDFRLGDGLFGFPESSLSPRRVHICLPNGTHPIRDK